MDIISEQAPLTLFPSSLREQNPTEREGEMEQSSLLWILVGGGKMVSCISSFAHRPTRALKVSQSKTDSLSNSFPLESSSNSAKGTRNPRWVPAFPQPHCTCRRKLMSRAPLGGMRGHQSSRRSVCAQLGVTGLFPAVSFPFLQHAQLRGFFSE